MTMKKTSVPELLTLADGSTVKASFPVVVSASRATDIPAFFAEWFSKRLAQGYCAWVNPFNAHQKMYVSFAKTRAFVFWSKNPKPLFHYLPQVEDMGLGYYFQYTVNDYDAENLEPGVASLNRRVDTFLELSQRIGPERVVWRFDPLLGGPNLPPEVLLERINRLADRLKGATQKLVISFADIAAYRKVQANLGKLGAGYRELTEAEIHTICHGLTQLRQRTGLEIGTCAEDIDLSRYGIAHNRCVDDDLLAKMYPNDEALMSFLGREPAPQDDLFATPDSPKPAKKDPGQRKACGCIVSKDIGAYNTCPHLCTYCYANASQESVLRKFARRNPNSDLMLDDESSEAAISARAVEGTVKPLVFHPSRLPSV
jgi:DNA repair photolyase